MKKYTAEDFGYEGHEMLMNWPTSRVETSENWAKESTEWEGAEGPFSEEDIFEQFSELYEVVKDKNGEWITKDNHD